MMRYQLKTRNKFLLKNDEVTLAPCMPSAINPSSFFWYILYNRSRSSWDYQKILPFLPHTPGLISTCMTKELTIFFYDKKKQEKKHATLPRTHLPSLLTRASGV